MGWLWEFSHGLCINNMYNQKFVYFALTLFICIDIVYLH